MPKSYTNTLISDKCLSDVVGGRNYILKSWLIQGSIIVGAISLTAISMFVAQNREAIKTLFKNDPPSGTLFPIFEGPVALAIPAASSPSFSNRLKSFWRNAVLPWSSAEKKAERHKD